MSGEISTSPLSKRHPWDWYVEEQWVTHRLADFVDLEPDATYLDPCCGQGNIVEALRARSLTAYGTDLFDRYSSPHFMGVHDWLGDQVHMLEAMQPLSIIFNPPYSRQDGLLVAGLTERFIRRALTVATHKVAALLPVKWLASRGRYQLFAKDHPPTEIWILCERPSMPPGHIIEQLGKKAFKEGKVDYMWVVWDRRRWMPHVPISWIPARDTQLPLLGEPA